MQPLIPGFANSFQVTLSMATKEIHIRFLALTPKITVDNSKPAEYDIFEVGSIFVNKEVAKALHKNLEQALDDFETYDAETAEAGVKDACN